MSGNHNPPAFPHVTQSKRSGSDTIYTHVSEGMSLRDWFAGKALAGLLASPFDGPNQSLEANAAHFATVSYAYADAMLVARKRGQ